MGCTVTMASLPQRLRSLAQGLTVLVPLGILPGQAVPEILFGIVIALFLIRSFIERDWAWVREPWFVALSVLWAIIVLRSPFSQLPEAALSRTLPWIHYPVLLAALTRWVLNDETTQRRLIWSLTITVLFIAADALFQYTAGFDITGKKTFGDLRLTGPFRKPYVGIVLVWLMFPVLLNLLGYVPVAKNKNNFLISAGILLSIIGTVLAVYLSGERMALLLCVLGIVLTFIILRSTRRLFFFAIIAGIAAMVTISLASPTIKKRQIGQSTSDIANYWHTAYGGGVLSAFKIWKDHPIIGIGMKNFYEHCKLPAYGTTSTEELVYRCPVHPHNIYMEWLVEGGLVAFLLYFSVAGTWFVRCWRERAMILSDPLLGGLFITLCIRFWPLSATTTQFTPWSASPFWLLLGFLLARIDLMKDTSSGKAA